MRNLNFLRKSERKSVGTTLALTAGSPSVDRRGAMLKLISVLVLILTIGIGNVWGNKTIVFAVGNSDSGTTAASINTTSSDDVATLNSSYCYARTSGMWVSSSNNAGTATLTMKAAGQVKATKIVTTLAGTMSKAISIQVTYTDNTTSTKTSLGTATGDTAYALNPEKTIKSIQYTASSKSKASISQLVIHEVSSGSSNPSVSVKQGSTAIETLNVPAAGATNQTLTLEYANIKANSEGTTPSINFYSNAACTSASSQGWFSATGTNKTTVTYSAGTNTTGSTRSVYAVISNTVQNTAGTNKTVRDTITISQASLVLVTNISVKASTSLEVDATETLTATVTPDNASDKSVTWSSDDEAIATVDENGKVTGVAIGTTNIKATANDGSGVYGSCAVTVIAPLPKIIIDGVPLTSTATTQASTIKFGNAQEDSISVVLSDGAKFQTSTNAVNHFGSQKSIFIGKADKYIYNSTPIPGNLKKFELYANYGASTSVSVSVTFSRYPLTAAGTGSDTLYTATLSTLDNVYDCSAKIPEGAKYFYYKVTNAYNSQVQFRITYEPITSPVTITAPTTGTLALANGQTAVASGDNIDAGTELTVTATPNAQNHYIGGVVKVVKTADPTVDVTSQVLSGTTLTMPEYAITVSATFTPTYEITQSGSGGTIAWEANSESGNLPAYFAEGTEIVITANADNTHSFSSLSLSENVENPDIDGNVAMFTMPAGEVTATVVFSEKSDPSISVTDGEDHPVSALNFGTTLKMDDDVPAAKTFVIAGANLTSALTVESSEPSLYAVSYAEGALTPDANKEVEATITITPQAGITSTAGTKSADITISGGGLASSVVVTASMTVQQTYTVNFYINGGEDPSATQTDVVGTTLNIPSDFSAFTDCSSFTFLGWKDGSAIDGGSSTTAPTLATVGTEITAADKNYYAVFAEGTPGGYAKVTAVNQLAANDKVVITYNDERAMKAYNGSANYYDTAVIVVADNKITSLGNACEFTLGGEEDAWTFSDGTYYVYSAGSAKSGGGYNNNMKGQTELTDAGRWTIAIVNGVTSITSNGNSATPNMRYNTSNPRFSCYNSGQSAVDIYRKTAPIYTKYYTTCPGKVAKPEISGVTEGETYDEEQTITITCGTSDATILYSTDGNAPATAYTAPFKLSANGSYTIRAKATKTDFTDSDEATAISFTIDKPFTTIRALIEANLEAQTSASIAFTPESNAIITAVNSTNRYIQDASGYGIVIRSSEWNEAAVQEKKITGKITGSWKVYNGQMQLENATFANDVAFTDSELPTASTVTAIDAETFVAHPTALVKIENVTFASEELTSRSVTIEKNSNSYTLADAVYVLGHFENNTYVQDYQLPLSSTTCDVTGLLIRYTINNTTTYEIVPVKLNGIDTKGAAAQLSVSPIGGANEGSAVGIAPGGQVTVTPVEGFATTLNSSAITTVSTIPVTGPTSITVSASRPFYTTNEQTYYYKVDDSYMPVTVNQPTNVGGSTIAADITSAQEGNTIMLSYDLASHYHFNGWNVYKTGDQSTTVDVDANNQFEMPAYPVTVEADIAEDGKYTIVFDANDAMATGVGPSVEPQYANATFDVPGCNTLAVYAKRFAGWKVNNVAVGATYTTPAEIPTEYTEIVFVAQWVDAPTFDASDHEWQLVTSENQLAADNYYLIASTAQGKVAGDISSQIMAEEAALFSEGVIAYNAFGSNHDKTADDSDVDVAILQLGGEEDAWTFTDALGGNGLLGATAAKKLAWGSGTTTWSIGIGANNNNATIQNGTSSYGSFRHNVNDTRFTTYTSNTSATMLLPHLYVWAEKVYKLRYDANTGTNAPEATIPEEGEATVTDEIPTAPIGKIFDGWNANEEGDGASYEAGDKIAISGADVTIYAQWRDPESYTVSYNANGGTLIEGKSDIASEVITEGEEHTVKANVYEKEDFVFGGWEYAGNVYQKNDEVVVTEDITFVAKWVSLHETDFVLVTDINQLKNGDKVYIVAANYDRGLGAQDGDVRTYVEIGKSLDKSHIVAAEGANTPVEFTLGKSGNDYTFYAEGEGYLYSTTVKKTYTREESFAWAVTITAEGVATISAEVGDLKYNSQNPRFTTYASGQQALAIYKKLETLRTLNENQKWGTICPAQEVIYPSGASFYKIAYVEKHSAVPYKVFYDEIGEDENLEAGQPYLFIADDDATAIKGVKFGTEASSGINDHGFIGVLEQTDLDVSASDAALYRYYIVYQNEIRLCGEGGFRVGAERAYLDMMDDNIVTHVTAQAPGRRRVCLTNDAVQQMPTEVESIEIDNAPRKVMIDGQIYIIRGEKLYDVRGQLVK